MVNGRHLNSAFIQSAVHLYSAFIQSAVHLYSAFIQSAVHLYSAFIQSSVQFMLLIHPFTQHTHTHTHTMQGTNQLVKSNWGLGVLLRDTSRCPGWDQTGNPPTASPLYMTYSPAERIFQGNFLKGAESIGLISNEEGNMKCGLTPLCEKDIDWRGMEY